MYVHHLAFRRLYCCPRRRITCPRMMKLAATSGIGARINNIDLNESGSAGVSKERSRSMYLLHQISSEVGWAVRRPQTASPAEHLCGTGKDNRPQ